MGKIQALDFAEYVESCKNRLVDYSSIYKIAGIRKTQDFRSIIERLSQIPLDIKDNAIYNPIKEIDIPSLFLEEYSDANFAIGYIVYDIGIEPNGYLTPSVPKNCVAVFSDGEIIDNRLGSSTLYKSNIWDLEKDIKVNGEQFNARYCIIYHYDTIALSDSYSIVPPHYCNTIILKDIKCKNVVFGEKGNSMGVSFNYLYLLNCNIEGICGGDRSHLGYFCDLILNNSYIDSINIKGTSKINNEYLTSTIDHERLNKKGIKYSSTYFTTTQISNYKIYRTFKDISSANQNNPCEILDLSSNNKMYIGGASSASWIAYKGSIKHTADVTFMDSTSGFLKFINHSTVDLREIDTTEISCFSPFKHTNNSGPYIPTSLDILVDNNEIDFNLDLRLHTSTASSYSYSTLSVKCLKNIFSKLKDNSETGVTRTITIGGTNKENYLSNEIEEARRKGWTVS